MHTGDETVTASSSAGEDAGCYAPATNKLPSPNAFDPIKFDGLNLKTSVSLMNICVDVPPS